MVISLSTRQGVLSENGLHLDDHQAAKLERYEALLLEWNGKINLVSRKDERNIWPKHILHSLSPLFDVKLPPGTEMADIGSGGGLPGIPMAIANPSSRVTLIESIRKKCTALEDMVRNLALPNVRVVCGRAEDTVALANCQMFFDVLLARAVAPLADLLKWSLPLARRGQSMKLRFLRSDADPALLPALIAVKGGDLDDELESIKKVRPARYLKVLPINFVGMEKTGFMNKQIVIIGL
jgi:16S rRNA (guanine527-N7)-methyltransferase